MKTKQILLAAGIMLITGAIFYSCQKEQTTQPVKEQGTMTVKAGSSTNCNSCVTNWIDSKATYDVYTNTSPNWDLNLEVYNNFGVVHFKLYDNNGISLSGKAYNVTIDGTRYPTSGNTTITTNILEWTITKNPWSACSNVNITNLNINGIGHNDPFGPYDYYMQELCTTTTLVADKANPVCVGEKVTLTATVTATEAVTAGTLTIFNEANESMAYVNVVQGVNTVTYDYIPAAAGDATFHAGYVGAGGYANSASAPITVTAEVCGCTNWQTESAFGGETAGAGSAWWFYYDGVGVETIWAGQNINVGNVDYSGGIMHITLTGGWELNPIKIDEVSGEESVNTEPVKIQGYATEDLPTDRPATGPFTTYKGTSLNPAVGTYDYYVIHLDVRKCLDE